MARTAIRERLSGPDPYFFAWCSLPGVQHADSLARLPFEGVGLDMQHGLMGFSEMAQMVPVIARAGKNPVVRVVWNEAGLVGQALDAGAEAIIAPMVNTESQARALVQGAKYPPMGGRSWGAYAASLFENMTREEYLARGNELGMIFAMIETQEAIDNLDAIVSVEGIDGVFVGPSDLTISLTGGKSVDTASEVTAKAMRRIAEGALKRGRIAGAFGAGGPFCQRAIGMGYRFFSTPSDTQMLALGAAAFAASLKAG